ncbi:MAG: hypothetical protein IKQ13_13565 [Treponema sp.]|nr:hypothetical protein [Treponema sp.]
MADTQVVNRGNNGNSDIHIIVKNVPKGNVKKTVDKVVDDIKKRNPKSTVSVITGPSHKMRKLERRTNSNQKGISNKPNGGEK